MIRLDDIKNNPIVDSFVRKGNEYLGILGYTEHSYRHINLVSTIAYNILKELDYPERTAELASIAGYMHDIGNVMNRNEHGISGAALCFNILINMGMRPDEVASVISAVANHEEEYGQPINDVAAALIMADKSDVHRSRVRNPDFATFDIHDRVNYAVEYAFLRINKKDRIITMDLTIDNSICSIMEYFEIFLSRMMLCRRAATFLKCNFELITNGSKLL
ncbi:MAG TPA: phosphohydrolase [Desulfotomaculum sp.]|nr:MAG: Metal dependent phosphohydrolase [Desulfotomaculum sp. 46_80]KUK85183.1 MAG: Metal dependent phosphohydrolase [Desulfofundulus kuznetsovii]HAG12202.1 phosphohydrolase [Desulfotomaculum sp.]HBY04406.1 phosphohydrolase [Desulfotomaculum sp.]